MRKTLIVAVVIGWMGGFSASAQNKFRSVVDPSFSTNNYKHPNKAAAARKENPPTQLVVPAYDFKRMNDLWTPRGNYSSKNFTSGRYNNQAALVLPGNRMENHLNPSRSRDNYKIMNTPTPNKKQIKSEEYIMVDMHENRNTD